MELMRANREWSKRPADERFTSLIALRDYKAEQRAQSRAKVVPNKAIRFVPGADHKSLAIAGSAGVEYAPTSWAFSKLCGLGKAPAAYLSTLPAEIAAAALQVSIAQRETEDVGLLLQDNGSKTLRSANGPNYGRVWDADIADAIVDFVRENGGDGTGANGDWSIPIEFGRKDSSDAVITPENTTFYASDRNMFVFLANERNKIELPNRRDGKPGLLSRGFFVWNSEVGDCTLGMSTFLFDYMCGNHIVWGASDFQEIKIRHTVSAPHRWIEEITPALRTYGNASTGGIVNAIENARKAKLDDVDEFLSEHFGPRMVATLKNIHELEEFRPIENAWDVATAATAYARSIPNMDNRLEMERNAGEILRKVA